MLLKPPVKVILFSNIVIFRNIIFCEVTFVGHEIRDSHRHHDSNH
jgi:hypothetical protein